METIPSAKATLISSDETIPPPVHPGHDGIDLSASPGSSHTPLSASASGADEIRVPTARHPVVIIPGITSTSLEVWAAKECAARFFRERLWGGSPLVQSLLLDVDCWLDHITPSPSTGLDKPGVRVRAASGLGAADAFLGVFSLWRGLLRSLARLGYDESAVHLASFDWRMRFPDLERRDRWFSRLKLAVEELYRVNGGRKVVFLSHSMGSNLFGYFLQWVHSAAPAVGEQCPFVRAWEAGEQARQGMQGQSKGAGGGNKDECLGVLARHRSPLDPDASDDLEGGRDADLSGARAWECMEREAEAAAREHDRREGRMYQHMRRVWLTAEGGWEGVQAGHGLRGGNGNETQTSAGNRTEQQLRDAASARRAALLALLDETESESGAEEPFGGRARALPPQCDGWWAQKYVADWVLVAGTMMGAPKVATVLWSGEMRDTAQLGPMLSSLKEQYMTRKTLRDGFRSMPAYWSLLPMGGARLWGGLPGERDGDAAESIAASLLEAQREAVLAWNGTGAAPAMSAAHLPDQVVAELRRTLSFDEIAESDGAGDRDDLLSGDSREDDPQGDGSSERRVPSWVTKALEPGGTIASVDQVPGGTLFSRFAQLHDADVDSGSGAGAGEYGSGQGAGEPTACA